jgi:F-type H+-transporting ATPase subunit epsilon
MTEFPVSIYTAEEPLYEGPCEALTVPMEDGQFGILAHHTNMMGGIVPGTLTYQLPGGEKKVAAVSYGILKVENGEALLLVDSAEHWEDIDLKRAQRDAEEAKRILSEKRSQQEYEAARIDLARAINRLRVHHRHREE